MNNNYKIFTTSWFIFGLSLLLLNDFVLKEIFGNGFTGKLSDFSGLLIFPLFWTSFFPNYKKVIFLFTALLFIIWKSPLSQPFIDGWNGLGLLPISRVVDYTDLYALFVLPLAYHLDSIKLQLTTIQTRPIVPILITAFAFGATSYSSQVKVDKTYTIMSPKDSVINRIQRLDSVYLANPSQKPKDIDTIWLSFPNKACQGIADFKVVIEDQKDSTTAVTLLYARYDCPKVEDDETKIIQAFEERVLNEVGN